METIIADGLPDKEIAQRLGLSRSTVKTYLGRVSRYGLRNRAQAVARFPRAGGRRGAEPVVVAPYECTDKRVT